MGIAQEAFIREFLDAWGDGTPARKPDVEKIVSMMADDAEWQLWVPGGPTIRGRQALREEIGRQMTFAGSNKCNIVHMLSSDRMVMTERADEAVINGRSCPHQMVAVYELDETGLISAWREYLDMEDLKQKMAGDALEPAVQPTDEQIASFITDQYRLWSEDKVEEMLALFQQIAPGGYTIQYVGQPVQEGEPAMAEMIHQYRGKVRTDLLQLIVNGNEAAAHVANRFVENGASMPSIETYRFDGGRMEIRYFHQPVPA
jgi:limonene-1,2-epoxide hydrolase